jgi:hypothetical protein
MSETLIGGRQWWLKIIQESHLLLSTSPVYEHLRAHESALESVTIGGASDLAINALEQRIGRSLCWSYRELLLAADGPIRMAPSIGELLTASAVDLYCRRAPDLVSVLMDNWKRSYLDSDRYFDYDPQTGRAANMNYHGDHLDRVVEITSEEDEITILLDPLVVCSTGEWEAWFFGPGRLQGAFRYRSLPELAADRLRIDTDLARSGPG